MTTKTMFVTKGSLTNGKIMPLEVLVEQLKEGKESFYFRPEGWSFSELFRIGKDTFHTKEEAVAHLEAAREKKLRSLAKQAEKLRGMVFAVPEARK